MEKIRPSRTIFGILLVLLLGYGMYLGIIDKNKKPLIGKTYTADRVSYNIIQKNVLKAKRFVQRHQEKIRVPYKIGQANLEDGAANTITSIVVDYRGFDTLGEVMVLFTALTGFLLIFPETKDKRKFSEPSFLVKNALMPLFLVALLVGIYVVFHGHLTPGGGFAGGAVIATGFLLLILANYSYSESILAVLEEIAGLTFLTFGLLGLILKGSFLQNFLPTGKLGMLISSGIILYINLVIGLKVASELGSLLHRFIHKED